VEPCEARALLSGGFAALPISAAAVSAPIIKVIRLNGSLHGTYRENVANPDTGAAYDFKGSGRVSGFGDGSMAGHLHTIGFIAVGRAQGELVLSGARGTITLKLLGPEQHGGPKALPDVFKFTVVAATGKYVNDHDSGTATIVTNPGRNSQAPIGQSQGTFTLVLTSYPVPSTPSA